MEQIDKEIIVTNLVSKSFPIIRYRLGDNIEMSDEIDCPCGIQTPIIKSINGRAGSFIYGKKNNYPSLTLYYYF